MEGLHLAVRVEGAARLPRHVLLSPTVLHPGATVSLRRRRGCREMEVGVASAASGSPFQAQVRGRLPNVRWLLSPDPAHLPTRLLCVKRRPALVATVRVSLLARSL